jgi:HD superfamily phosphohydrolase
MASGICSSLFVVQALWGGKISVHHSLIQKIILSPAMERLKGIDQSGPDVYLGSCPKFSRFDHSIGVWMLLKKVNAPLKEQIAGLLHDASHLTFSHVADFLYDMDNKEHSYQDTIHLEYLKSTNILETLGDSFEINDLNPDLEEYKALEQPLPDMCADRIQYNIHTGILTNLITQDQGRSMVDDLKFENQKWYFEDSILAYDFAKIPLYLTKNMWGSGYNHALYHYFSLALKRALALNLINKNHLHFGTDLEVMGILLASPDQELQNLIKKCKDINSYFKIVGQNYDKYMNPKFRGIDPLVKKEGDFFRLSDINKPFKQEYTDTKKWCLKGYGIKFID